MTTTSLTWKHCDATLALEQLDLDFLIQEKNKPRIFKPLLFDSSDCYVWPNLFPKIIP